MTPEPGDKRQPVQRQDSLTEQMRDVWQMACDAGCYDALLWIQERWKLAATERTK